MTAMATDDPYDLQRFVTAQDAGGTYQHALAELRAGRKTSHWMWFVFPQVAGLGYSPTSRTYAITSLAEARAYLAHPVLGARPHRGAGLRRGRRAEVVLLHDAVSARRSRRAGVPAGAGPVLRRDDRLRD